MAQYVALCLAPEEIAIRLGCGVSTVRSAKASPLFKKVVRDIQREISERVVAGAADAVALDAADNVEFLRGVRDGRKDDIRYDGDDDFFKYRMDASKTLFGAQIGKKQDPVSVDMTHTVLIEREDREALDAGILELGEEPVQLLIDDAVDGEEVPEDDGRGRVKTLDELLGELE